MISADRPATRLAHSSMVLSPGLGSPAGAPLVPFIARLPHRRCDVGDAAALHRHRLDRSDAGNRSAQRALWQQPVIVTKAAACGSILPLLTIPSPRCTWRPYCCCLIAALSSWTWQ